MDYEDEGNFTYIRDITPEEPGKFKVHEIVFIILCLVAICADVFIIYIIFHYKRMRTVPNLILANWAISNLCFLILTPSSYTIISVIDHSALAHEFICHLTYVGLTLHYTNLVFTLFVVIDWCLAAHFEKLSEKFRWHYKFVIAEIWICSLLSGYINIGLCLSHYFMYWIIYDYLMVAAYSVIFLVLIVLQSQRAIQKCMRRVSDYPPLMLNVVSSCAFCWSLGYLGLFIINITEIFHPMLGIIGIISMFCNSIVTFIILYRYNKDFHTCFLQVLRRRKINYEETDFVFHSTIRKSIVKQSA